MSANIRVFDSNSIKKLRDSYKCIDSLTPTNIVPVMINNQIVNMSTGEYGTNHLVEFKNYSDTVFTTPYSYMFLIYLTTGDYTVGVGTGNMAFISFSSSPLKDSVTYFIQSGIYLCQIFVEAKSRLSITLKKKNETYSKYIYAYALKCESIESNDILFDNFYEQIADDCINKGDKNSENCKRSLLFDIETDPRLKVSRISNLQKPGTIINGEWVITENTCPSTCGTGSKKSSREIMKYLGDGAAEKSIETIVADCSVPCPVNGYFSNWSAWSTCSKTCGSGTQTRSRTYTPAINGGVDLANRNVLSESQTCNTQACVFGKIVMKPGESIKTSFSILSNNGLYKLYWNGGYWIVLYALNDGKWTIYGQITFSSTNKPSGLYTGNSDVYLANAYSTKTFAYASKPILYSAVTDNGKWVFVMNDYTTSDIIKYGDNTIVRW